MLERPGGGSCHLHSMSRKIYVFWALVLVSLRAAHLVSCMNQHGASGYGCCERVCVEKEICCVSFFVCLFVSFSLRGHQHSGSVLRNSSNYLTFAGINNTCAFSGFILIKPFWSGARPKPAPGKAGKRLVAQDGKSGGQLRAGWKGTDEAGGPLWQRWTPVSPSRLVGR